VLCTWKGLPPGHTAPCYPISIPGIRQHRVLNAAKDSDADAAARARFALLGNAVTVQVGRPVLVFAGRSMCLFLLMVHVESTSMGGGHVHGAAPVMAPVLDAA
jgi:hypothetical protein